MATCNNENRKTNCTSGLKAPVRNQYFYGKLLTVRDFETEQSYHIKKQRLINRHIHGEGVVCGLEVVKHDDTHIKIKSGIALDCCGREIVVPEDHIVDLAGKNDGVYWLTISYSECGKEPVAAATETNSCEEECCFSRVEEGYEINITSNKPDLCSIRPSHYDCAPKDEKPLLLATVTVDGGVIIEINRDLRLTSIENLVLKTDIDLPLPQEWQYLKQLPWNHNMNIPPNFLDMLFTPIGDIPAYLLQTYELRFNQEIKLETVSYATLTVYAMGYSKIVAPFGWETEQPHEISKVYLPVYFQEHTGLGKKIDFKLDLSPLAPLIEFAKAQTTTSLIRVFINLKGDLVEDKHGRALDANFIRGIFPSGNGVEGGLFETWVNYEYKPTPAEKLPDLEVIKIGKIEHFRNIFQLKAIIKNSGTAAAKEESLAQLIDLNVKMNEHKKKDLATAPIGKLGIGKEEEIKFVFEQLPSKGKDGKTHLRVIANADNTLKELNTDNNTRDIVIESDVE